MSAAMIPFPITHRSGKIRHTADILRRKNGQDAERYWRQTVLVMRRQMIAAQIDPAAIDAEISAFEQAVFDRIPGRRHQRGVS